MRGALELLYRFLKSLVAVGLATILPQSETVTLKLKILCLALLTRHLFASDWLSYAHGREVSRRVDLLKLRLFV